MTRVPNKLLKYATGVTALFGRGSASGLECESTRQSRDRRERSPHVFQQPAKIAIAAALFGALLTPAAETESKVQGVLIDRMCSYKAVTRVVPGPRLEGGMLEAYVHKKDCALMPECQKSGYGVFTYDGNKFLAFDETGNQKAADFFKQSKQEDNFRVEVTGIIEGDTMRVASIQPLT